MAVQQAVEVVVREQLLEEVRQKEQSDELAKQLRISNYKPSPEPRSVSLRVPNFGCRAASRQGRKAYELSFR